MKCAFSSQFLHTAGMFAIFDCTITKIVRLASVAGAVIQAIGRPDFEDGMRTGVQLEVSNGLQCVRTKPVVKLAEPLGRAKTIGAVSPLGGC